MLLRAGFKNWKLLRQIGLSALVVASLVNLFWHASPGVGADVVDAVKGFLYGVSIATLLLSIVWQRRMR